jgi:hypothetical protein
MKTVKKNVYYCDFCNKRGLSATHIKRHELGCTANPRRECRLCGEDKHIETFIILIQERFEIVDCEPDEFSGYTQKIVWHGEPVTLNEILEISEGCPNCTLAILRQTKLNHAIFDIKYDYKAELNSWWSEKNKEEWEKERREMAGGCYY